MNALTFNQKITDYINGLTPGVLFYAPLLEILKEPEIKKRVSTEKEKEAADLMKMFDLMKSYDLMFTDNKLSWKLDHAHVIERSLLIDTLNSIEHLQCMMTKLQHELQRIKPLAESSLSTLVEKNQEGNTYE